MMEAQASTRVQVWSSLASLFASGSTLVCCALPAMLVALGAGAALSTLVAWVPQIVWLSEHKEPLFAVAGVLLALSGAWQWSQRHAPCPIDPALRNACLRTRRLSLWVWVGSVGMFLVGGFFAFVLPWLYAA